MAFFHVALLIFILRCFMLWHFYHASSMCDRPVTYSNSTRLFATPDWFNFLLLNEMKRLVGFGTFPAFQIDIMETVFLSFPIPLLTFQCGLWSLCAIFEQLSSSFNNPSPTELCVLFQFLFILATWVRCLYPENLTENIISEFCFILHILHLYCIFTC